MDMPSSIPETTLWLLALGLIYLLAVALLVAVARRRDSGEAGFYLAGRSLGTLAATSTLAATAIGSSSTILMVGLVYSRGLSAIWLEIAAGIGLIALGMLLARRLRRTGLFTLPELAGSFYGRIVRRVVAVLTVVAEVGWLAMLLKAAQVLLQPVIAGEPWHLVVMVGAVFIGYTIIGGQLAVARTDVLQLVMMCTLAAGVVSALALAPGVEWSALPDGLADFPLGASFPTEELLPLALVYGMSHLVGSDIYGKLLSARNEVTARKAAVGAGWIKILFGVATGAAGLAAAMLLPAGLPEGEVLSSLVLGFLPAPLAALAILALLAALMSSADSILLTAGTVVARDLLRVRGAAAGKLAIAAIGVLAVVLAGYFATLLDAFRFAYTLFTASLTVPILFGFWHKKLRLSGAAAAAAMAGGAATVIIGYVAELPSAWITSIGLGVCCVLLFSLSWLGGERAKTK